MYKHSHDRLNPDDPYNIGIKDQLQAQIDTENLGKDGDEDPTEESYDAATARTLAEQSLNFLAGLAIPTVFEFLFPPILLSVWQLLTDKVKLKRDFSKIALGIPRGFAKTTVIKLFVLYVILFTDRKFILIISDTATKAENIVADIVDMLNETNIMRLFGDWKIGAEMQRQDLKKFTYRGRAIIIAAIGAGGSIRGLNLKNERPDVEIFDDIQTRECADSDVMSKALERWLVGTAMKAKSPRGCLYLFAANMYPTPHSILKKMKANKTWIKFITGAIIADKNAPDGIASLWEELRPLKDIIEEFDGDLAAGHPEIFFAEVLNDTEAGINTRTDLAAIKDWPWSDHDLPQGKFILIDPSANKQGGDDVAIGYCELFDGFPGLRKVIEENLSPGNTIRKAIILALETNTRVICVESTAYQSTLLYWFGVIADQLGITGIHFVEIYSGAVSKNARITDMLKSLTAGEILVHGSVKSQVMHQIANWSPLRRNNVDGILDLLTYMMKVVELYGHLIMTDTDLLLLEAQGAKVQEGNWAF